ncbi:MAG: hypothetical protein IH600_09300 [Bacteroidetes bacterium]|nr:hypothetical protein [Bacteroidota bacterium]
MPTTTPRLAILPLVILILAFAGCSTVELTSVVDTQFLLGSRLMPLQTVLVVYDTRDLALKQDFESSFADYIRANTSTIVHTDIELYSPLKKLEDKEKVWALKDNNIDGVIYLYGGGSGRPLRDWLLPEAPEIDADTPAWKSSAVKLFLPSTGQVVWAGSVVGLDAFVGVELNSRGFFSAVVGDLVRRGMLDIPRPANPGLRGFNR